MTLEYHNIQRSTDPVAEHVLPKIDGPWRRNGDGWLARCPAHDDKTPSLSVHTRGHKTLVYCHAGCEFTAVVHAVGLDPDGLFHDDRQRGAGVPVAEYTYTDEHGTPLFIVERLFPKSFRQKRPDGSYGVKGVRQVPYRLPEALAAVQAGHTLAVVEGEKDVDALMKRGYPATCNPGGAGKWRDTYSQLFTNANVFVIADNDEKGYDHARQVAASLRNHGANMSGIWTPDPTCKDMSEHLTTNGAELQPLRQSTTASGRIDTKGRSARIPMFSDRKIATIRWAWKHRMPVGELTLLVGRGGVGKGLLSAHLAAKLTTGTLSGSFFDTPRRVLWVGSEDNPEATILPRLIAAGADLGMVHSLDPEAEDDQPAMVEFPNDFTLLREAIQSTEAKLVIFDPLLSTFQMETNTWSSRDVRRVLQPLRLIAQDTDAAFAAIAHPPKNSRGAANSAAFTEVARAVLECDTDEDDSLVVEQTKNNLGRMDQQRLRYTKVPTVLTGTEEGVETMRLADAEATDHTIDQLHRDRAMSTEEREERDEVMMWLEDYIERRGGSVNSAEAKRDAMRELRKSERTVQYAAGRSKLISRRNTSETPRTTLWTRSDVMSR